MLKFFCQELRIFLVKSTNFPHRPHTKFLCWPLGPRKFLNNVPQFELSIHSNCETFISERGWQLQKHEQFKLNSNDGALSKNLLSPSIKLN